MFKINSNKPLCVISSLCAALLSYSVSTFAADGRIDYDLDNDGYIEINDLTDLNEMRNSLNGKSLYGSTAGCPMNGCIGYELTTNLDFDTNQDGVMDANDAYWNGGEGWISIGQRRKSFNANFNGNGKSIRNLYINRPSAHYQGLFAFTGSGTISNVVFEGPLMQITGNTGVGSLVGSAIYTTIQNVSVSGLVVGNHYVGGLVGSTSRFVILNQCINLGRVESSGDNNGGLVGSLNDNGRVMNSFNIGQIQGSRNTGGLVGYAYNNSVIGESFNVGVVLGRDYTGGIVGQLRRNIALTNVFNTGHISSNGTSLYLGGLVGFSDSSSRIRQGFSSGKVSGEGILGGLVGHAIDLTVENSYWAVDASTQNHSEAESEDTSYVGLSLSILQCPIQANTDFSNSNCVSSDGVDESLSQPVTLYKDWDETIWDFGEGYQLPALVINGSIYRDSDGDGKLDSDDATPYDHDGGF